MISQTPYRIVQPWGRDKAKQSTIVAEFYTIESAFAEIDRIAAQMLRTGAQTDSVELVVIDNVGNIVTRPNTS